MRMVPGWVCAGRGPTREASAAVGGGSVMHPSLSSAYTAHVVGVCTYECASLYISVGIHAHISSATLGGIILLSIRRGAQQ